MSDDELRDKLAKELFGRCPSLGRTVCVGFADALMPVVVEALAAAWDDGAEAAYEWQIGVTGKPDNPWREDD